MEVVDEITVWHVAHPDVPDHPKQPTRQLKKKIGQLPPPPPPRSFVPMPAEEEMAQEPDAPTAKKIIESVTKESFFSEIEALKKENEELKAQLNLSSEVAEEVAPVELSEEPKPISFNPENETKVEVMRLAKNRNRSTMDSIFEKFNNI
jgi:hypothetical protein